MGQGGAPFREHRACASEAPPEMLTGQESNAEAFEQTPRRGALHRDDLRARYLRPHSIDDREANEVVRDVVDQHLWYRAVVEPTAELR